MSYIALYRKWRPLTFSDVVEQQHVVTSLRNTVMSRRIAHAYLFCGTRGTGKTSMAKIFARAINCTSPENGDPCNKCEICRGILNESLIDVIEIDAASNNKVENVRDIRDEVAYSPASAEYKVYIIDEVHMMTTSAFNALLKTLEEPPPQVVFILATTDPHKLPATILSRCQRFDFKRISKENIALRLKYIAENSDCFLQDDAAALLSRLADGALRDGVSLLDQCISIGGKEINVDVIRQVTGMAGGEYLSRTAEAIESGRPVELIDIVGELIAQGKDLQRFSNDLNGYFRDLLVCFVSDQPQKLIDPSLDLPTLQNQAKQLGLVRISEIIRELSQLEYQLKQTTQIRTVFEAALIRMACLLPRVDASLEERFSLLEQKLDRVNLSNVPSGANGANGANGVPIPSSVTSKDFSTDLSTQQSPNPSTVSTTEGLNKLHPFKELQLVIGQLNSQGKRMVSSYLVDAHAYVLDDNVIGIVSQVGSNVLTKPENSEPIILAIQQVTGQQMRLRVFATKQDLQETLCSFSVNSNPANTAAGSTTGSSSGSSTDSTSSEKDISEEMDLEEKLKKAVESLGVPFTIYEE